MGPRKMIKWVSHRGRSNNDSMIRNNNSPTRQTSSGEVNTARRADMHTNAANRARLPQHSLPELPFRFQVRCKRDDLSRSASVHPRNLLARRGVDDSKRDVLILQPNKRPRATPITDPDFFDDTPASTMLMLENFSKATLASPFGQLTTGQTGLMLEKLSKGRVEYQKTPVCESSPNIVTAIQDSFDGDSLDGPAQMADSERSNERPDSAGLGDEIFKEAGVGAKRPPNRSGCYDDAPISEILKLEGLSQSSLDSMSLVTRLNASMINVDRIFDASAISVEMRRPEQASILESQSSTVRESPCELSSQYFKPREAEHSDAKGKAEEDDPFLYLAWTSMPVKARSSRRQARHKIGAKPCPLPLPHPEIVAAQARISSFKSSSPAIQLGRNITTIKAYQDKAMGVPEEVVKARQRIAVTSATVEYQAFMKDLVFLQTYADEMKARCEKGVWWEGWLIIEDLRDRGVLGSNMGRFLS